MLSEPVQLIARKDCPRNDLLHVEREVKQLLTHSLISHTGTFVICFSRVFYGPGALPDTEAAVLGHWKCAAEYANVNIVIWQPGTGVNGSSGVSRHMSCLVFHVSVLAQSRHLYVLSWLCLEFVSSYLVSHDCVLTVSLSGISTCFFCVETLAFLAEQRSLGPFICGLVTYHKTVVVAVVVL